MGLHPRPLSFTMAIPRSKSSPPRQLLPDSYFSFVTNEERVFQKKSEAYLSLFQSGRRANGKARAFERASALLFKLLHNYPSRPDLRIRMLEGAIRIERHQLQSSALRPLSCCMCK